MSSNFISSFPYPIPREIQKQCLQELDRHWNDYDVFVLVAPTAFGKTALAKTLMNSLRSVSVITPTNLLVQQFLDEFPDTQSLHRMDSYRCTRWGRPCPVTRARLLQFCKPCQCSSDLATAKYRRGPGVYNYHTYLAHKLYRDVLVVDEAHNLIPVIRDRLALRIWQHDYKYPDNMYRPDQILGWVSSLPDNKKRNKKIVALRESALADNNPQYMIQRTEEWFSGKGTLRGEPELRDVIRLLPVDIREAPPMFWPRDTKKVVLMSATIGPKDIEMLGIGIGRRVCYIHCKHPIDASRRPIIGLNTIPVSRANMTEAVKLISREIEKIAEHHYEEKGVIHATYQLASYLQNNINNDRFIFHDRNNKTEKYRMFLDSSPRDGRILVASGMYEGIDLPEDLGRWQVIAKVPWPSLADPATRHLSKRDPKAYIWECLKTTIQACGRICRTPEDVGHTYIVDSTFQRLLDEAGDMSPQWFLEAVEFPEKQDS